MNLVKNMNNFEKHNIFKFSKQYSSQNNPGQAMLIKDRIGLINPILTNKGPNSIRSANNANETGLIKSNLKYINLYVNM